MDRIGLMGWVLSLTGVLPGLGYAQAELPDKPPGEMPAEASKLQNTPDEFRFEHVRIDRKTGTVTVDATVVRAQYALEFLLCKAGTKEYESVLATPAEAWQIHAGLLMLGLSPGLPAVEQDGKYNPPRGAGLQISIEWKDGAGRVCTAQAADWFKASTIGKGAPKPKRWIFVGSNLLPDGQYEADDNGGIISVANLPSSVIDVPFASTKTIDRREYVEDKKALPPAGTEVQLIITPEKDAARADYARALLEIDRNNQLKLDGQAMTHDQLAPWAEQYISRHKHGTVVIRSAAEALSGFAPRVGEELRLGGVFDIQYRTVTFLHAPLPRTAGQSARALAEWQSRFKNPGDEIQNPAISARLILQNIQIERAELERLNILWAQYAKALEAEMKAYNAMATETPATQPGSNQNANPTK